MPLRPDPPCGARNRRGAHDLHPPHVADDAQVTLTPLGAALMAQLRREEALEDDALEEAPEDDEAS